MQDTGCLGLVHWDDPEGWYGEGGGRGVQDGEHVAHPGPSPALAPPPSLSHQSICGDCIQGKMAHEVALMESGEKGDQGIPGVPGLDSCTQVGGEYGISFKGEREGAGVGGVMYSSMALNKLSILL